jgi:hypothetical protein
MLQLAIRLFEFMWAFFNLACDDLNDNDVSIILENNLLYEGIYEI